MNYRAPLAEEQFGSSECDIIQLWGATVVPKMTQYLSDVLKQSRTINLWGYQWWGKKITDKKVFFKNV